MIDPKQTFAVRYAGIHAMRFCYGLRPQEYRQPALKTLEAMLPDGDVADFAVEDLRKWKLWDLTPSVLAQYGKKSRDAPLVRRHRDFALLAEPFIPRKPCRIYKFVTPVCATLAFYGIFTVINSIHNFVHSRRGALLCIARNCGL